MGEEEDFAIALAYVHAERARHEAREAHPYDGVLGVLPEWCSDLEKDEFLRIRNKILDYQWPEHDGMVATPEGVHGWIQAYCSGGQWPEQFSEEIGRLAQFLNTVNRRQGFAAGKQHAERLKAGVREQNFRAEAGKARAGVYGVMRQVIERLKPKSLSDFLRQLEDERCLDKLQSASLGPIDFEVQDIYEGDQKILYISGGVESKASFRTIRNYISMLKK
jgi:hypothetical protein